MLTLTFVRVTFRGPFMLILTFVRVTFRGPFGVAFGQKKSQPEGWDKKLDEVYRRVDARRPSPVAYKSYVRGAATKQTPPRNEDYFTLSAPRSSLIVKFVMSQTSLGPQYWIGPG